MVDAGFEAGFLDLEAGRAAARLRTDDCRRGRCGACGVCHDDVSMDLVGMTYWLLTFARGGSASYLSHLDTVRAWRRTFARAGVDLCLSQGMRPKPRLALGLPLPVGAAAVEELLVAEVTDLCSGAGPGAAGLGGGSATWSGAAGRNGRGSAAAAARAHRRVRVWDPG